MPLSCDLHNNYFFPFAICGYWVTLTPNKLVFRHLIHLTRGEQPWCRPAQVTSKPCGFIKVVTLNLSSTCEGRMGFPPLPSAGSCLMGSSRQGLWGCLPLLPAAEFPEKQQDLCHRPAPGHFQIRIQHRAGTHEH